MDAKQLAVELQLSAKRGTVSGEQVNAVVETLLEMADKLERLEAENAKLRELVREMMRFFKDGDYCTICEKRKECDAHEEYDDDCLMRGVFHARMRELGVEVDG